MTLFSAMQVCLLALLCDRAVMSRDIVMLLHPMTSHERTKCHAQRMSFVSLSSRDVIR